MKNEKERIQPENCIEPLWNREQVAKFLRTTPGTVAVWDCTKQYNLKPIKIGRSVRYCPHYIRMFALERFQKHE